MGQRPPKSPEPPKTPEAGAPEADNKGGTVRKKRKTATKATRQQDLNETVDALYMLEQAGADPALLQKSYNNTIKAFSILEVNDALMKKGANLSKFQSPTAEVPATPTNMVTQDSVTTGSVVPVTSSDGSLPPVPANAPRAAAAADRSSNPTPEQAEALRALGLAGNESAQQAAPAASPATPSIKEMIGMLMGQNAYTPPADPGPPVLSQVRNVDPADVASQPTVELRTGEVQPKPATQPFRFPPGLEPGSDDGRVQLSTVDLSGMQRSVEERRASLPPVQWYVRQNRTEGPEVLQLSGPKEPNTPKDADPFADIPLDPNSGFIKMKRNRANIINKLKGYALLGAAAGGGLTALGTGMYYGIPALSKMLGGGQEPIDDAAQEAASMEILRNYRNTDGFR